MNPLAIIYAFIGLVVAVIVGCLLGLVFGFIIHKIKNHKIKKDAEIKARDKQVLIPMDVTDIQDSELWSDTIDYGSEKGRLDSWTPTY